MVLSFIFILNNISLGDNRTTFFWEIVLMRNNYLKRNKNSRPWNGMMNGPLYVRFDLQYMVINTRDTYWVCGLVVFVCDQMHHLVIVRLSESFPIFLLGKPLSLYLENKHIAHDDRTVYRTIETTIVWPQNIHRI